MSNNLKEIQIELSEYFKDTNDKVFSNVIDMVVYHNGTDDVKMSKIVETFLDEMGIKEAYMNYVMEMNKPSQFFVQNPTDIQMIVDIKQCLLSIAFNRFSKHLEKKSMTPPLSRLSRQEKADLRMVLESCERENDVYVDEEEITRDLFDFDEANDLIAERKRLKKLYPKVLKIIK